MQGRRKKDEGQEGKFFILHSTFFIREPVQMPPIEHICGYLRLFAAICGHLRLFAVICGYLRSFAAKKEK
jgi:hypothetical protein